MQGLLECECCGYAYYGKQVSRSSAKGKVPYAYYRCVGTDAYRFGGKRVSDLEAKLASLQSKTREQIALRETLTCLESFSETIHNHLDQADWTTRREILRTLVERVVIEPDQIRIVYRVNFPLFAKNASKDKVLHFCWRSDFTVVLERVPALCV